MLLTKAIEMADQLCPNAYSLEEKIRWCDEVTASIRRSIKKCYTAIETTASDGEIAFPNDFTFEDLEVAYFNDQPMDKLDLRTFLADKSSSPRAGKLKLIFLDRPAPTRLVSAKGSFDVSENFIKIAHPPFEAGDTLEWVYLSDLADEPDWDNAKECYVLDRVYDGLMVNEDAFEPQTAATLALRRVIDDITEVEGAPYDGMYVEYMLAKMALYQHDYTAYGTHMAQYNTLYETLRRDYKSRSALNPLAGFHRYW